MTHASKNPRDSGAWIALPDRPLPLSDPVHIYGWIITASYQINPLPPDPHYPPGTLKHFWAFFRRNFTPVFWVVLCPKHLLVIEGNYQTFQNKIYLT
jgi:hypothetical protein